MKSPFIFWLVAVVITLSAVYYQRVTGPTRPIKTEVTFNNELIKVKLPRSHTNNKDCQIDIIGVKQGWNIFLFYRKYPGENQWTKNSFVKSDSNMVSAWLPKQPAAGKLEYYVTILNPMNGESIFLSKAEPVIIRFKNPVPAWALIPHILLMFIAMLLSNLTGAFALFMNDRYKFYSIITFITLLLGGFVFGPIVQKYAFGSYWTGFPMGMDLTDNKTLIAIIAWLIAVIVNLKEKRPLVSLFASIIMLIVFSIPHSLRGSELNYETGKVVTGFVDLVNWF